jgi:hypothetical protein
LDRYVRLVGVCGLDGGSRRSSVDCSECVHPGGGMVAKVTSRRLLCVVHATATGTATAADVMYSVRMGRRHCMVLVKPTYLLHTTSTYLCAGMLPKRTAMYMHTYVRR